MRAIFGLTALAMLLPVALGDDVKQSFPAIGRETGTNDWPHKVFTLPTLLHNPISDLENWQRRETEISKLIADLGDLDFRVRDKAAKRLDEIGLPALGALQNASENRDLETRRRAKLLVSSIQQRAIPSDGMEFKLIAEPEWLIPQDQTTIKMQLEMTNRTDKLQRVDLEFTIGLCFVDDDGEKPVRYGGQIASGVGRLFSPALERNESFIVTYYANLQMVKDQLVFYYQDDFANFYSVAGLKEGKCRLVAKYNNSRSEPRRFLGSWYGRGEAEMEINIKRNK